MTINFSLLKLQELRKHFAYDDKQLSEVSDLLLRMKELAHRQTFGDILLSTKQAESILENLQKRPAKRRRKAKKKQPDRPRRSFSSDPDAKWADFPIKYRF
ncbi:unnamed protein product, partial [Anisakis simplex]|uniref:LZ_Tnp_IS66 domain-containing protein n=1 Tax=Anisakis simplex TaxID=6269 RepID=A0A0M3KHZ9_ANISI